MTKEERVAAERVVESWLELIKTNNDQELTDNCTRVADNVLRAIREAEIEEWLKRTSPSTKITKQLIDDLVEMVEIARDEV